MTVHDQYFRVNPVRGAAALVVAAGLFWLSTAATLDVTTDRGGTGVFTTSYGVRGLIARSETNLADRPAVALADAKTALVRGPVQPVAARNAGLALAQLGQIKQAQRAFAYSERLSRRDFGTQLWLIEDAVRRNDIPQALVHYDRALRTSRAARDQLLPVLVAAADDTQIAEPLARLIRGRAPWVPEFLNRLSGKTANPTTIVPLLLAYRPDPNSDTDIALLERTLERLRAIGHADAAQLLFHAVWPTATAKPVQNSGFEASRQLLPFGWAYQEVDGVIGFPETLQNRSGRVLTVQLSPSYRGVAARQFTVVASGRYRLSATGGEVQLGGATPFVRLTCDGDERMVGQLPLAATSSTRRVQTVVTIPANCRGIWLSVVGQAPDEQEGSFWIDDISLDRLAG